MRDCMASLAKVVGLEDVRAVALALPESSERSSRGLCQRRVRDRLFVWERPLRASEIQALAGEVPSGAILGARVEHLLAKEALLASEPDVFLTTPHFDGYAAILVRLEQVSREVLREVIVEAWLCRAPVRLAKRYSAEHLPPPRD